MSFLDKKVAILMATFNGARFISQQMDSLIEQEFEDWILYIRDDSSNDGTLDIVKKYAKNDLRIKIIEDDKGNLGARGNFAKIIDFVRTDGEYDYYMFCDQDDVWHKDKILKSLEAISALEAKDGGEALVYGTLKYTDENGKDLGLQSPDFSVLPTLPRIITGNYVYGCTVIINRSLYQAIKNIPEYAENHDYWIALLGTYRGASMGYIKEPLISYRQHGNNVSGSYKDSGFKFRLKRFVTGQGVSLIKSRARMLRYFYEENKSIVYYKNNMLIEKYLYLIDNRSSRLLFFCLVNGFLKTGIKQSINHYLNIFRFIIGK